MENGIERFRPVTQAEGNAAFVGAFAGVGVVMVPLAIEGEARKEGRSGLTGNFIDILALQDLKREAGSAPDSVAQPGIKSFLNKELRERQEQVKAIKQEHPRADTEGMLMEIGGGASLGALVLATLTCAVRYRMHRVSAKRVKKAGKNVVEGFEDLLKSK